MRQTKGNPWLPTPATGEPATGEEGWLETEVRMVERQPAKVWNARRRRPMLDVVEDLVADAVRSALPAGTDVLTGATPALDGIRAARVVIFATALTTQLSASPEHVRQGREPAQMLHRYTMGDHPGTKVTSGLPTVMSDLIAEVHCPPGRLLSTDLYAVDERTMHFFSERDGKVVVLTRPRLARIARCCRQTAVRG